jgi:hypothetical protein
MTDMQTNVALGDWQEINAALNRLPYSGLLAGRSGVFNVQALTDRLGQLGEVLGRISDMAADRERELDEHRKFVTDARRVFDVLTNGAAVLRQSPAGVAQPYTGPTTPLKD